MNTEIKVNVGFKCTEEKILSFCAFNDNIVSLYFIEVCQLNGSSIKINQIVKNMRQASLIRRPKNPQANSNFLSKLTFWYTLKIFYNARGKDYDEDNLTQPLKEHESSSLGRKLAILWAEENEKAYKKNRQPQLRTALFRCFKWQIIMYSVTAIVLEIIVKMSLPLFLKLVLRYYSIDNQEKLESGFIEERYTYFMRLVFLYTEPQGTIITEEAAVFTLGLVFSNWLTVSFSHPYLMGVMHLGMKMRIACCSLIYRKALRLRLDLTYGNIIGNAINLLSNDVNRFDNGVMFLPYILLTPVQIAVITFFLYKETGFAAIFGILALILVMPLEIWLSIRLLTLRYLAALKTDERVRQMSELLEAIQVIKMYTWENILMDIIYKDRVVEIKYLKKMGYIKGIFMSFIIFSFRFSIFIISVAYILMGEQITAEKIFVVTSFLLILRQSVCVFFPQALAQGAELTVSLIRIEEFLYTREAVVGDPSPLNPGFSEEHSLGEDERFFRRAPSNSEASFLKITNASAKVDKEVVLKGINLEASPGTLTVIIGPVGSGKSCLLHLILGELPPFEGDIDMEGIFSYASQEPWLFPGSIRQNILLGREFNRRRYEEVCFVCALNTDFTLLPHGDKTLVGEKGSALSGGQRARVNLARAIYKEADIYLLDDPLSAVDTNVGKHLFDECITGFISEKVVILVTHQLQYLDSADQIVLMKDGVIEAVGDYEQLKDSGLVFSVFLTEQLIESGKKMDKSSAKEKRSSAYRAFAEISNRSVASVTFIDRENQLPPQPRQAKEYRSGGKVDISIYKQYFKASGFPLVVTVMFTLFFLTQLLASSADLFIAKWISMEEHGTAKILSRNACMIIYTAIILACITTALGRSFYFFNLCMAASRNLHDNMFRSVVETRMHFFHQYGPGTVLNRFSKDLGAIDELLPNALIDSIQICLNLVGVVLVLGVINPYFLLPTGFMCILFYYMRNFFLKVSSNLKRLESTSRSPVFAHVNSTFQGLATIRSNGAEHILTMEFDSHQDIHSSAWFMYIATSRAFGYWLDSMCIIYIIIIAYSFMFTYGENDNVGLAITQVLNLTGMIQWGIRQSAELGNQMVSVERVIEYTKLEPEPNLRSDPAQQPPPDWPTSGTVEFSHAYMKYGPQDAHVLRDVSFFIQDKEKVGIVGRTGAGKSSLIAAMFRLAYFFGEVRIDNLDIGRLCLHDLRKKISIIPQEPVLFSGTLLYNLDPFGEFDRDFIMEVLIGLENKEALMHGMECLQHIIVEGGANVSVGERQIICLARALLRNNKIIIMDEATANIDAQTDKFIQSIIRTKFANCTVLTVAHRLHTIMDSDKVLVMDAGQVAEFDHPHILLQDSTSIFSKMVEKTGEQMADSLKSIAKNTYDRINSDIS